MPEQWKPITGLDELAPVTEVPSQKSAKKHDPAKAHQQATAESPDLPGTLHCTLCSSLLSNEFYGVNAQLACANCAAAARAGHPIHSRTAFKAGIVFGIGAAALAMVLFAGVTILTHLYLGYAALAAGWIVGKAMMRGSNGVGGRQYQVAAVLLTYAAISMASIPVRIATIAPASDIDWGNEVVPMALLGLVYRDQLFPREAYRQTFDRLLERLAEKPACRLMVNLLALAHERGCEAELATLLEADLAASQLPDLTTLRARFAPDPAALPEIVVHLVPLTAYEALLGTDMALPGALPGALNGGEAA